MFLINKSWANLKPNEDEKENYEWFDEYYVRIKNKMEYKNFPKEVFEQWIYPHYDNYHTIKNYAWLNYNNIVFELQEWKYSKLEKLYIIKDFRKHVELRASYYELNKFCCIDNDLDYWKTKGTWRVPPIVLDTTSIEIEIPYWSEISNGFQLVEGHSRLGYLKSINRISEIGDVEIAKKHKVYLMKVQKKNNV